MELTKDKAIPLVGAGVLIAGLAGLFRFRKTMPAHAEAVKNFDIEKYLGTWYEIARFDYRYETHMSNVTATYSRNADGSVKVDNRGYDFKSGKWKESVGVAKPLDKSNSEGRLKVSFFRPFYASYNVIALDEDYHYAMVAGKSLDYLWFLSREPFMPEDIRQKYLRQAERIGYKTGGLTWVDQDLDAIGI